MMEVCLSDHIKFDMLNQILNQDDQSEGSKEVATKIKNEMKDFKLHSKPKDINYGCFYKKISCINIIQLESTLTHFKRNLRETLDKIVEKESKALHKSLSSELSEEEYNIQRQNVEGYLQKGIALISMQMIIKEIVEIENTIKERLNTLLNSVDADVAEKSDYSHLLKAKRNKFIEQKAFKTFMHNVRAPISDDLESSNSSSFSFTKKTSGG